METLHTKLGDELKATNSKRQTGDEFIDLNGNQASLFSIHHPVDVKLLVILGLGFTHLREHKLRHNFHDTLNPLCFCRLKP